MNLLIEIATSLEANGWTMDGGGDTLAYLHNADGTRIKLFRWPDKYKDQYDTTLVRAVILEQ